MHAVSGNSCYDGSTWGAVGFFFGIFPLIAIIAIPKKDKDVSPRPIPNHGDMSSKLPPSKPELSVEERSELEATQREEEKRGDRIMLIFLAIFLSLLIGAALISLID